MNPLLTVWIRPKETMEYIIEHKTMSFTIIMMLLASVPSGILAFADSGLINGFSFPVTLLMIIFGSMVLNLAGWTLTAGAYTLIGRMLGGTGTFNNMFRMLGGVLIPTLWTAPIALIGLIAFGSELFKAPDSPLIISNLPLWFNLLNLVATIVVGIYGLVLNSMGTGLVHGFSSMRGFGTIMIFAAFLLVVITIIVFSFISSVIF